MWDFSFSRALAMVMQTLPFVVLRILVYVGIALAYVLTVGVGGALGWGFGHMASGPEGPSGGAIWGSLAGFGLLSAAIYMAREYLLYLVKAAHIAVLVQASTASPFPRARARSPMAPPS